MLHSSTQKILLIVHAPPYGSERCFSALRLALGLAAHEGDIRPEITLFLMSDAVVTALPNQQDASGRTLQEMLEDLIASGVKISLCQSCARARGIADLPLVKGCNISTLIDLAVDVIQADKVITF